MGMKGENTKQSSDFSAEGSLFMYFLWIEHTHHAD